MIKATVELNGQSFSGDLSCLSLSEIAFIVQGCTVEELLAAVAGDCHAITVHFEIAKSEDTEEFSYLWADLEDALGYAELPESGLDRFAEALLDEMSLEDAAFCASSEDADRVLRLGFSREVLFENLEEIALVSSYMEAEDEDAAIKMLLAEQDNLEWARIAEALRRRIGASELAALAWGCGSFKEAEKIVREGRFEGIFADEEDFTERLAPPRDPKEAFSFDYSSGELRSNAIIVWRRI